MKVTTSKWNLVLLVVVPLLGFSATAAKAPATNAVNIDQSATTVVQVEKGKKQFSVTMKSNRTTGYSWYLLNYNSKLIKPVSYKYAASTSGMVGAPGRSSWTFAVRGAGLKVPTVTQLTWVYVRPWLPLTAEQQRKTVSVYLGAG